MRKLRCSEIESSTSGGSCAKLFVYMLSSPCQWMMPPSIYELLTGARRSVLRHAYPPSRVQYHQPYRMAIISNHPTGLVLLFPVLKMRK